MRASSQSCVGAGAVVAAMCAWLSGCAATSPVAHPQQFRTFLLPPEEAREIPVGPIAEAPLLATSAYANEAPDVGSSATDIPQATGVDFILKRAEDHFAAGKRALQEGRTEDARVEFDRAVEILLNAPEDTADRPRLEKRLQEMADDIYRYDSGELGASEADADTAEAARPIDEALEMTFPVDPNLRSKVQEQIQATVSQLPLEENDAVLSYVNYFSSTRGKKTLEAGLRRSGRYKAMIERVLAEEGLPQELIFLAQAESGFYPRAISPKICVGLWQFIKFRGEEYGLQVNSVLDERMDPEKATRAAAHHLHDLYTQLGDWYLAMAAYDCGPGCIDHAVQRTGYADFWALRRLNVLPKETANYVPIILAMIIVSKNAKDYGLDDIEPEPPLQYETVELEAPTSLSLAASALDHPVADLKDLNPALLRPIAPAGYQLHIPIGTREALEQGLAAIPAAQRDSWRLHRVSSGDTFSSLATRYGTTAAMVSSANSGELPESGAFAAIPVSYPGDHPPLTHPVTTRKKSTVKQGTVAAKLAKPASRSARVVASPVSAPTSKTPGKKPAVAQASKKPAAKPAVARTPGA